MRGSFSSIRLVCFFRQKTAYGQRISDWSSDVCSSDLRLACGEIQPEPAAALKALLRSDPRVGVHQRDGYAAIKALLPPAEKRGLEIGRASCRERVCQYV